MSNLLQHVANVYLVDSEPRPLDETPPPTTTPAPTPIPGDEPAPEN